MPHWVYFLSAANAFVSLAGWRTLPLTVVRLVGALTKDPERSKRCAEILRLARKDAKDLPSYLLDLPGHDQEPATATVRLPDLGLGVFSALTGKVVKSLTDST